jgi:putative transposase
MTKVLVEGMGGVYIVIVLDWYTKAVVGHYAGLRCTARHWLEALDMAVNRQFPQGARGQGVSLMSDNGCQPTSTMFMQACATLEIHQTFTSYNNPKGNADTERFMRTLKEECLWLQEWTCPFALETISITDEPCPAPHPQQGTGQLQQTQEVDGVLLIADQEATTF